MIYLPVSTVAVSRPIEEPAETHADKCEQSIFSMTIFNWAPGDGSIVSKYLWVFLVVAAVLTVLTLLVWQIATCRQKKKAPGFEDLEIGGSEIDRSQPAGQGWT